MAAHLRVACCSVVLDTLFCYRFYSYQRLVDKCWLSFALWCLNAALGALGAFGCY